MNVINLQSICNKGTAKYNEDIIGFTPHGLWVLDGATGLNKKNLVSNESDAKWYVNWWNDYLYSNINKEVHLKEIVREGIEKIKQEFIDKSSDKNISELDKPSSSICIVRLSREKIEYFILGDCELHTKVGDKVSIIRDTKLCVFDNKVYKEMMSLPNRNTLTHEEIRESVMDTIISNRLKKNTEEGYWILEFETNAVDNAVYGEISIDNSISMMLISDGYSCVSERYKLIEESKLIEEVKCRGINEVFNQLRRFEEELSANEYPRFKIKDDSSCIYLEISIEE